MTSEQIQALVQENHLPGKGKNLPTLEETHISWVLLNRRFAFKIKKPVTLAFLDFSTLKLRRMNCEQEVKLNAKFSPEVYLKVVEVKQRYQRLFIGEGLGKTIDYAVQMKRLDSSKQMHRLLLADKVGEESIRQLAKTVAQFHTQAVIIKVGGEFEKLTNGLQSLSHITTYVALALGEEWAMVVRNSISTCSSFLQENRRLLAKRTEQGYVRECHGDLHSQNIFLYKKPVLFDCIEFNKEFREIDILSEVAFLCMDLDKHGKKELSHLFLNQYLADAQLDLGREEQELFLYYKLYRAGVRAAVTALRAMEQEVCPPLLKADLLGYLALMKEYVRMVNAPY